MTSSEYSSRSRTVRRAAKDLLRKYRNERRQRDTRGAAAPTMAAELNVSDTPEAQAPSQGATLRASARAEMLARSAVSDTAAPEPENAPEIAELESAAEPEMAVEPETAGEMAEAEDAPCEAAIETAPEPETAPELESVQEPAAIESAPPPPPSEPSDLHQVPGIGPGLIWVLQQAGVNSLAALAAANPDELRAHLGVIGDLVDIDSWIEWAKTRAAS